MTDFFFGGGAVANRLRRRTSDQTVLGSNPAVAAALSPWTRLVIELNLLLFKDSPTGKNPDRGGLHREVVRK